MGNRSSATANSQTSTYYQGTGGSGSSGGNALNQYGSRGVPRVLDIAGLADSSATVTVNSQSTQRQGEHWFKQLALSGNSAQWQSVAVSISTGGSSSGSVLLKEHPEVYACDDDGNLTSDGRWTYTWDADGARQRGDGAPKARPQGCFSRAPFGRLRQQNRLRRMETASLAYTAGAPRKRIDYTYDDRGRRTLKSVYTWNTGTGAFNSTPAAKVGFLYHDWNLLHEIDLSGSLPVTLRSYYWGSDLSGTLQGAGGVGGLLAADFNSGGYFWSWAYSSDANGNVRDLVGFDDGYLAEHYEYDAFGNAFAESGGGGTNPFRFSTKYTETDAATGGNETGLLYYGFRYYNPSTGRWPNRDPIGIRGGLNLYGMIGNDPINYADKLGLISYKFDKGNCTLNVSMTWRLTFNDFNIKSSDAEYYKWRAANLVEEYFSGQKYACKPDKPTCPCSNGVKVNLDVRYTDRDYGYDFSIKVHPLPLRSEVDIHSKNVQLDMTDIDDSGRTVIHEAGHMMGLDHPGHDLPEGERPEPNSPKDYDADPTSIMGKGMELRIKDFQKAFCDQIKEPAGVKWTATATE